MVPLLNYLEWLCRHDEDASSPWQDGIALGPGYWYTTFTGCLFEFRPKLDHFEIWKYTIAKISTFIIFTVLGPFSCILGVFRVFAVFCRHCFSPIREKYTLAKILVGHSRTIDAPEIYPFYSIYRCKYLCIFSVIYNTFMWGIVLLYLLKALF